MTELNSMIAEDLDVCFVDWGTEVTLRQVAETFDQETQLISETYEDATATAISGFSKVGLTAGTAGQHFSDQVSFFVRKEEYPFSVMVNNARLHIAEAWYRIEAIQECATDLLHLKCRRMESVPDEA
ncbi:MAG: hypothetical protein KDA65_08920 [Planctomycetaceae bacterium]|nr:hypothetical protein [Planctomycetaceae bacterium]